MPGLRAYNSLVYSTYLGEYVAVGGGGNWTTPGKIFFQTSSDLMHWSAPVAITGLDPNIVYQYPSLIDRASTSRNFETIGQTADLYVTRPNNGTSEDRDLIRIPIEFSTGSSRLRKRVSRANARF